MKIAVVGSINMDMCFSTERMPKKGETLLGSDLHYNFGGKGANQAVAMARLGTQVWMFGCVGNDSNGKAVLDNLQKQGVHTEYVQTLKDVPTGLAIITIAEKDNMIVVVPGANERVDMTYAKQVCNKLDDFDIVVLQHEIPLETVKYVIEYCVAKDIKVMLNPAPAAKVSEELVAKVTYLTPNEHETKIIFGEDADIDGLLLRYPEKLIITRGSKGVRTATNDGKIFDVPACRSQVVDTTGAGDTFQGAFCARIAEGDTVTDAIRFANTAAGLSTERMGAQGGMPTEQEVQLRMNAMNEEEI